MANVGQLGSADADASAVSAKAIFSADELRKKEWREADAPMEPEELVHEAYRDGLTMHEDAVFCLNN